MMRVTAVASPNYNQRPVGARIDTIVLHADASANAAGTVSWLRSIKSKASYHVLVDRDGIVYRFVETAHRAWHAGASEFNGRDNVNDFSLGLSFANRNDGVEPYTDLQYQIGAAVCAAWMRVYPAIKLERITTHAAIAPGRKNDPLGFDMPRFLDLVKKELAK